MNKQSFRASTYLRYIKSRKTIQYIHSPFLFNLMQVVFDDTKSKWPSSFYEIENLRKQLRSDAEKIYYEDYGAGGDIQKEKELTVGSIAAKALKQAKYARFLYRLAMYSKSVNLIELGTSLGITTSYLAVGNDQAKVISVEADESIQNIAKRNWKELSLTNIRSYRFDLNTWWFLLSSEMKQIDFLFVDANHRKEAMIRYYLQALPFIHENSVVVFDDIHWDEETFEAWNILRKRKEVTLSFDIYQMGILFFDKNLSKENFTLKY